MAFYLVIDGHTNSNGESDSYVVRARGSRLAVQATPITDKKRATVFKLEDGKRFPEPTVILASLVDHSEPEPENFFS